MYTWTGVISYYDPPEKSYSVPGNYLTLPVNTGGIKTYRQPFTAKKRDNTVQVGFALWGASGSSSFTWCNIDIYNMYFEE